MLQFTGSQRGRRDLANKRRQQQQQKKTYDGNNHSYADHCTILNFFATYNLISVKFWTFVSPIYNFRRLILEKQFSFLFSNIITYVLEDLQTYGKKHSLFPQIAIL